MGIMDRRATLASYAAVLGAVLLTQGTCVTADPSPGLTVEVFGNSVMRGAPSCTTTVTPGFNLSLADLCPHVAGHGSTGVLSARITGTLTSDVDGWHRFAAQVDQLTWIRLWVDVSVT